MSKKSWWLYQSQISTASFIACYFVFRKSRSVLISPRRSAPSPEGTPRRSRSQWLRTGATPPAPPLALTSPPSSSKSPISLRQGEVTNMTLVIGGEWEGSDNGHLTSSHVTNGKSDLKVKTFGIWVSYLIVQIFWILCIESQNALLQFHFWASFPRGYKRILV